MVTLSRQRSPTRERIRKTHDGLVKSRAVRFCRRAVELAESESGAGIAKVVCGGSMLIRSSRRRERLTRNAQCGFEREIPLVHGREFIPC